MYCLFNVLSGNADCSSHLRVNVRSLDVLALPIRACGRFLSERRAAFPVMYDGRLQSVWIRSQVTTPCRRPLTPIGVDRSRRSPLECSCPCLFPVFRTLSPFLGAFVGFPTRRPRSRTSFTSSSSAFTCFFRNRLSIPINALRLLAP